MNPIRLMIALTLFTMTSIGVHAEGAEKIAAEKSELETLTDRRDTLVIEQVNIEKRTLSLDLEVKKLERAFIQREGAIFEIERMIKLQRQKDKIAEKAKNDSQALQEVSDPPAGESRVSGPDLS